MSHCLIVPNQNLTEVTHAQQWPKVKTSQAIQQLVVVLFLDCHYQHPYSCQKSSWEERMSSSPILDLQGLQQSQENRGKKLAFLKVLTFVWSSPVVKMLFGWSSKFIFSTISYMAFLISSTSSSEKKFSMTRKPFFLY